METQDSLFELLLLPSGGTPRLVLDSLERGIILFRFLSLSLPSLVSWYIFLVPRGG